MQDFRNAFDDVSASSSGGAPFLFSYGMTFLLTGIVSFFVTPQVGAMIAIFQGGIALPVAFILEKKLALKRPVRTNPLNLLSGQLAFSQMLALPALIVVYSLNPVAIPVVLSSLGGMHLLPYAWLQRTKIYLVLAGVIAVGGLLLVMFMKDSAFELILLFIGVCYLISAPFLLMHSRRILQVDIDKIS